eukprot:CAMPEP_0197908108 /NCGR_PEP_ID=MMETSP1439-20131203/66160_1 /TAXON_ID=66791 /ORGANISM="Gonyaulax spinifera, Strain CCMP409" /LENGTH=45 /DNA_ID= /DNA_START= /DNA_END= /DNA_ORIENTATION=
MRGLSLALQPQAGRLAAATKITEAGGWALGLRQTYSAFEREDARL